MFEVDSWDVGTEKEEKLVHSLFGEVAKGKRKKKEKAPNAGNKEKKDMKHGFQSHDARMDNDSINSQGGNPKKRKIVHMETKVETNQTVEISEIPCKKKKRKTKNKHVENKSAIENRKDVVERITEIETKKKVIKDKKAENECVEKLDGNGTKKKKKKRTKKSTDDLHHIKKNEEANKSSIAFSSKSSPMLGQPDINNKANIPSKNLHSKKSELQEKLKKKLESSRFRWINEQLYTIPGDEAFSLFKQDMSLFDVYHQGFRRQVEQWPINPVDVIIDWVKERSPSLVLADFGCGEAVIAASVPNKVYSFDLVAANDRVTACNMAKVPLNPASVDVAIFCLSLMGTDLESFLKEAFRVLKPGGMLKIAEVVSRMETNTFIPALCQLGFKLENVDDSNKMFILLDFIKDHHLKKAKEKNSSGLELKPCLYKRR